MKKIKEYIIDVMLKNIKDNIIVYSNNSDKYFKDLNYLVETINKDNTYLKYFTEFQDALMLVTENTLNDLMKIPYIYDFRDGL